MKNMKSQQDCFGSSQSGEVDNVENLNPVKDCAKGGQISHFLPTSRRIVQFSNGKVHQVYSLNSTENYYSLFLLCFFITGGTTLIWTYGFAHTSSV